MRILAAASLKTVFLILALAVAHLLSAIGKKKQSSEFVMFCLHLSKECKDSEVQCLQDFFLMIFL